MHRRPLLLPAIFGALLGLVLPACGGEDHHGHKAPAGQDGHAGHAGHGDGPTAPLKTIMADLAIQMNEVHGGLWAEDYGRVARAADAIAQHPGIPPEELQQLQQVLGDGFPAFEAADVAVHQGAVRLGEAARASNLPRVQAEIEKIDAGCVSCHAAFRERARGG